MDFSSGLLKILRVTEGTKEKLVLLIKYLSGIVSLFSEDVYKEIEVHADADYTIDYKTMY